MDTEFELFKGKKFTDLCRDIYTNQESQKERIEVLISELRPLIKKVEDAMIVVPLIKDYLNVSVSNDEHLVKLAAIIQKIMTSNAGNPADGPLIMTDAERKELWAAAESLRENGQNIVVKTIKKDDEE
jgi:hypothetical protein